MPRHRARVLVLVAVVGLASTTLAACELFPGSPTFVVTTNGDVVDADPGDGVCEATGGWGCTLRAAITEANASPVVASVTVPPATYPLSLPGVEDGNAGGDLDVDPVSGAMAIVGDTGLGFEIAADGADGGLDLRSGNIAVFGAGIARSSGDGVSIRSGALGAFTFSSIHGHAGAGVRVEAGADAQLWTTTVSGNGWAAGAGGVANQGLTTTKFATIADNGGGGFVGAGDDSPTAGVILDSSLVVQQSFGSDCADGALEANFSSSSDSTCAGPGFGNTTTSGPVLEPLSDITVSLYLPVHRVIHPDPASAARDTVPLDAGSCVPGSPLIHDQLGIERPVGTACDRGASEGPEPIRLVVDTSSDAVDVDPGDGRCATATGSCSLRAAIEEANRSTVGAVVHVAPGVDPVLGIPGRGEDANATGDLDITAPILVDGDGATIDGAGLDRLVDARSVDGIVELRELTLRGGDGTAEPGAGPGAVAGVGGLRLTEVSLIDNVGSGVGAVAATATSPDFWPFPDTSYIVLTDSEVAGNVGGPAVVIVGGHVVIDRANVHDNTGGGLVMYGRTLELSSSTFRDNTGERGAGASIDATDGAAIVDTWFVGNHAEGAGGGAFVGGPATVVSSTFSANTALTGGGLESASYVRVVNSTFSGNAAPDGGAALLARLYSALTYTTMVANTGPTSLDAPGPSLYGTIIVAGTGAACSVASHAGRGYNLFGDATCGADATDLVGVAPLLGPLADNGGLTPSHLPAPGSPAIDAVALGTTVGQVRVCPFFEATVYIESDQRWVARPQGGSCDLGSIEQ